MRKDTPKNTKTWTVIVCLIASFICASIIVVFSVQSCTYFRSDESLRVGTKAPEFRLSDFDGNEVLLRDIVAQNEYVLVEFWASWCGPCVAKIPDLKTVYSKYDDGLLEVISIAREESHSEWSDATTKYDPPWINLAELGEYSGVVGASYGLSGLPLNYLISKDRTIVVKDISVDALDALMLEHVSMQGKDDATSAQ